MLLFSIIALPLVTIFTYSVYTIGRKKMEFRFAPFGKGLLWFVIVCLLFSLLYARVPGSYKNVNLFFYYLLNDHLLFLGAALVGYFLFYGFHYNYKKEDKFIQSLSFLASFYTALSFFYFMSHYAELDFYVVFIMPLLRCSTVFLVSLFIDKIFNSYGKGRILYSLLILVVLSIVSLLSMLFALNYIVISLLLSVLFLGLSFGIYYLIKDL